MTDIKNLVLQNKIHLIYGCIILVLTIIGLAVCYKFSETATNATPTVTAIADTTPASVAEAQAAAGRYNGKDDAADVSALIQKAQAKPATVTFKTSTQAAADKQAQQLAAKDKADYVLKETTSKSGEAVAGTLGVKSEGITNNYYAVQQERKHRLAAGVTGINGQAYATVAYSNDRLTYEIHSKDLKKIDGVSVLYTIKKW